jgi:pyruvate kinase
MTSGETAMSSHPALVVETMSKILKTTEQFLLKSGRKEEAKRLVDVELDEAHLRIAVARSALEAAYDAKAKAIIVFSDSGEMAKLISKGRPNCTIIR